MTGPRRGSDRRSVVRLFSGVRSVDGPPLGEWTVPRRLGQSGTPGVPSLLAGGGAVLPTRWRFRGEGGFATTPALWGSGPGVSAAFVDESAGDVVQLDVGVL